MMRSLCEKVGDIYASKGRRRVIRDESYMIRHYLLYLGQEFDNKDETENKKIYPYNAFLHEIRGSDKDTYKGHLAYHDHPWPYTTVILTGGYWEHTPMIDHEGYIIGDSKKFYGPGSILRRKPGHLHYLEMGDKGTTWTLFMRGKRVQEWGFRPFMSKDKIHWKEWVEKYQQK
jgi:hypothetical protein